MGVPKLFRYLVERYPLIYRSASDLPLPECDNLYLDLNGVIHHSAYDASSGTAVVRPEEEMMSMIACHIEQLVDTALPRQVLFIAIDGVAPRAKMNQQRQRRFRVARLREAKAKAVAEEGAGSDDGEEDDVFVDPLDAAVAPSGFDSNAITPGTEFLSRIESFLEYFIQYKLATDVSWRPLTVYLSGPNTPGEGEHKIMEFIRTNKMADDAPRNVHHMLYGLDADLIFLGLASHELNFSILREKVDFHQGRGDSGTTFTLSSMASLELISISVLREYLYIEFKSVLSKRPFDLERVIDDIVFLSFLVGNDFLPPLPHLEIDSGGIPAIFEAYTSVIQSIKGYVCDSAQGLVSEQALGKIFEFLAAREASVFAHKVNASTRSLLFGPKPPPAPREGSSSYNHSTMMKSLSRSYLDSPPAVRGGSVWNVPDAARNLPVSASSSKSVAGSSESGSRGAASAVTGSSSSKGESPWGKSPARVGGSPSSSTATSASTTTTTTTTTTDTTTSSTTSSTTTSTEASSAPPAASPPSSALPKPTFGGKGGAGASSPSAPPTSPSSATTSSGPVADPHARPSPLATVYTSTPALRSAPESLLLKLKTLIRVSGGEDTSASSPSPDPSVGPSSSTAAAAPGSAPATAATSGAHEQSPTDVSGLPPSPEAAPLRKKVVIIDLGKGLEPAPEAGNEAVTASSGAPSVSSPSGGAAASSPDSSSSSSTGKAPGSGEAVAPTLSGNSKSEAGSSKAVVEETGGEEDEEEDDGCRDWKQLLWYRAKFQETMDGPRVDALCTQYIEGLVWVLNYYYQGVVSWSWCMTHHFAPLAADMVSLGRLTPSFPPSRPFTPFEQLLAVLPPSSVALLPPPLRPLMAPSSPIADFFPRTYDMLMDRENREWKDVALIPFIDEARFLGATATVPASAFSPEETARNEFRHAKKFGFHHSATTLVTSPIVSPLFPTLPAAAVESAPAVIARSVPFSPVPLPGSQASTTITNLKCNCYLRWIGATVVGGPSKEETWVISTVTQSLPPTQQLASIIVGSVVFVGWPYLAPLQVTALISTGIVYSLDSNSKTIKQEGDSTRYRMMIEDVCEKLHKCRGLIVASMIGMYVAGFPLIGTEVKADSSIDYVWSKTAVVYPFCYVIRNAPQNLLAPAPAPSSLSSLVAVGDRVIYIGDGEGHGGLALVTGLNESDRTLTLEVNYGKDDGLLTSAIYRRLKSIEYKTMGQVAKEKSYHGIALARLLSCVKVRGTRLFVGLRLKNSGREIAVPGYAKRIPNPRKWGETTWGLSNAAERLVADFKNEFPSVVNAISSNPQANDYDLSTLFPHAKTEEALAAEAARITKWMADSPVRGIPLVPEDMVTLDEPSLEAVRNVAGLGGPRRVVVTHENAPLANILVPKLVATKFTATRAGSPYWEDFQLGQRVAYIRECGPIPLGNAGYVVSIQKDLVEVAFDVPFLGGTTLGGRVNSLCGAVVNRQSLLNLTLHRNYHHSDPWYQRERKVEDPKGKGKAAADDDGSASKGKAAAKSGDTQGKPVVKNLFEVLGSADM